MKTQDEVFKYLSDKHGLVINFALDGVFHKFGKSEHIWAVGSRWAYKGNEYWAIISGSFHDSTSGKVYEEFTSWDKDAKLSTSEKKSIGVKLSNIKTEIKKERSIVQEKTAISFRGMWDCLPESSGIYNYCKQKGLSGNHCGRVNGDGELIIPIYNSRHELCGGQRIFYDVQKNRWSKRYLSGTEIIGSYGYIGNKPVEADSDVFLCEGYSTAASIFEALKTPVFFSMQANNLKHAAKTIRKKFPTVRIIIAADDDSKKKSTGEKEAREAVRQVSNCTFRIVQIPDGQKGTDFNDLAILCGLDEVRKQLDLSTFEDTSGFKELVKNGFTDFVDGKPIRNYQALCDYIVFKYNYYYMPASDQFFIYRDGLYRIATKAEIKSLAQKYLSGMAKTREKNEFYDYVQCREDRHIKQSFFDDFDQDGNFINFKNGILKIKTNEIIPHSKKYHFLLRLNSEIGRDDNCVVWDDLLGRLTTGRKHLQEALEFFLGYIFSGFSMAKFNLALILKGGGSNGKSTFLNIVTSITGSENVSSVSMSDIPKDRFLTSALFGKMMNISEEEPPYIFKKTGIFKKITGNSLMDFQFKGKNTLHAKSKAKVIISYNEQPPLYDSTLGMKRRLLIIPFDLNLEKSPGMKIPNVMDRIKPEYPEIVRRCINVFLRYYSEGILPPVPESIKAVRKMEAVGNSFFSYWESGACSFKITGNGKDLVFLEDIRNEYKDFCVQDDVHEQKSIGSKIKSLAESMGLSVKRSQKRDLGALKTVYIGVKRV